MRSVAGKNPPGEYLSVPFRDVVTHGLLAVLIVLCLIRPSPVDEIIITSVIFDPENQSR